MSVRLDLAQFEPVVEMMVIVREKVACWAASYRKLCKPSPRTQTARMVHMAETVSIDLFKYN